MLILGMLAAYALVGLPVALALALLGPGRLLAGQPAVSPGARLILIPGAMILWPLVVHRLLRRAKTKGTTP
jgi:hypothetical protein